jgi:hypothetical protein
MTTPLEDAQAMVATYTAAEQQLLAGKEVRLGTHGTDRWHRMEDLAEIRAGRKEWEARVTALLNASSGKPTFGGLSFSVADFSHNRY